MIKYDPHSTMSMLQIRGSLIPQSLKTGLLVSLCAFLLKWAERQGHVVIPDGIVKDSTVYSSFSFTLGFVLVFRTGQSYSRFWHAATQMHAMRSNWFEAASSLTKFVGLSTAPEDEVMIFRHTIVRLMSMLGATALSALAVMKDENFAIVDVKSFHRDDMEFLIQQSAELKPNIVYQWILSLIIQSVRSGMLNVPPPILTRAFQQMERGMVEYGHAMQVMEIPIPFPYTQICWVLIRLYMVFTPFMMCRWSDNEWAAALFTLVSVMCIKTINLIASEIENPLGDDVNDLPVHQYHNEFNDQLVLLLLSRTRQPPTLLKNAILDAKALTQDTLEKGMSLEQYVAYHGDKQISATHETEPLQTLAVVANGNACDERSPQDPTQPQADAASVAGDKFQGALHKHHTWTREFLEEFTQKLQRSHLELNELIARQTKAIEELGSRLTASKGSAAGDLLAGGGGSPGSPAPSGAGANFAPATPSPLRPVPGSSVKYDRPGVEMGRGCGFAG